MEHQISLLTHYLLVYLQHSARELPLFLKNWINKVQCYHDNQQDRGLNMEHLSYSIMI